MSRIGKIPVTIPAGVEVTIEGQDVRVKGPKGELFFVANDEIKLEIKDNAISVTPVNDSKDARSKWGMSRTMIENILKGVKDGFERKLEINGVGYRASLQGKNLQLALGYSHTVNYKAPEGVSFEVPAPTQILVRGIDKQQVGQVAAEIRDFRKPEPYKGKGVRYKGEYVIRKAGKAGK